MTDFTNKSAEFHDQVTGASGNNPDGSLSQSESQLRDPEAQNLFTVVAEQVAQNLRGSVTGIIKAAALLDRVSTETAGNDPAWQQFLNRLVGHRVITPNDVQMGRNSSKISKLISIGKNRDWLVSEPIFSYLPPCFTTIYALVQLHGVLPGRGAKKMERLVAILNENQGEVTREFLTEEKESILKKRGRGRGARRNAKAKTNSPGSVVTPGESYDLVLAELDDQEISRLAADYANPNELIENLPFGRQLTEDAAVVIVTAVVSLHTVVERLLAGLGFNRPERIFLAKRPDTADITRDRVIIVAVRGDTKITMPPEGWFAADMNTHQIAETLLPAAKKKLCAFKAGTCKGWRCLGDNTWAKGRSA